MKTTETFTKKTDLDYVRDRLSDWELIKKSLDDQADFLKNSLVPQLVGVYENGDMVVGIQAVEEILPALQKALEEAEYSGEMKDKALSTFGEDGLAKRNEMLREALKMVNVQGVKAVNMVVPNMSDLAHVESDTFFIRVATKQTLEDQTLVKWDESIGLSQHLAQRYVSIDKEQLKLLYSLFTLMQLSESKQSTGVKSVVGINPLR